MYEESPAHTIGIFLIALICINLFILDFIIFSSPKRLYLSDTQTARTETTDTTSAAPDCGDACRQTIQEEVTKAVALLPSPNPSSESRFTAQTVQIPSAREYYIPVGSGSTTKTSWEDMTTAETLIDPSLYGTIEEAHFIVSLRNPTQNGQLEAQLYNVTDKHPVWGSHVVMNGPISQTITSGPITLDTGSKLYRVQLKSTLGYIAYLDSAKLRIVTKQ